MTCNLRLLCMAASCLLTQPAWALDPAQTMDPGTLKLFVAHGESTDPMTIYGICDQSTMHFYQRVPSLGPWPTDRWWEFAKMSSTYAAMSCRVRADLPDSYSALRGRNLAVFASSENGFAGAVHDAVDSHALAPPVGYLNFVLPTTQDCALDSAASRYYCTRSWSQRPTLGVAEGSESLSGFLNQPDDMVPTGYWPYQPNATQSNASGLARLYGVYASKPLYRALQQAQGLPLDDAPASRPNISHTLVTSYANGTTYGWSWLLGAGHHRAGDQVNLCMPRQGSGVRAVMQSLSTGWPCSGQGIDMARFYSSSFDVSTNESPGLDGIGNEPGQLHVVEGGASERSVEQCVARATERGAMALALVSAQGYFTDTASWVGGLLKVGGVAPVREQALTGRYPYVGFGRFFWNDAHVSTLHAGLQQLVRGYAGLALDPAVIVANNAQAMVPPYRAFGTGTVVEQAAMAAFSGGNCQPYTMMVSNGTSGAAATLRAGAAAARGEAAPAVQPARAAATTLPRPMPQPPAAPAGAR